MNIIKRANFTFPLCGYSVNWKCIFVISTSSNIISGVQITVLAPSDAWALLNHAFGVQITSLAKGVELRSSTYYQICQNVIFCHITLNVAFFYVLENRLYVFKVLSNQTGYLIGEKWRLLFGILFGKAC